MTLIRISQNKWRYRIKNIKFEYFIEAKLDKTLGCQLCCDVKQNRLFGYCDLIHLGWVLTDGSCSLLGLVFQLVCHWSDSAFFLQSTKLDYGDHSSQICDDIPWNKTRVPDEFCPQFFHRSYMYLVLFCLLGDINWNGDFLVLSATFVIRRWQQCCVHGTVNSIAVHEI
jgi:hypothetical protein